MNRHDTEKREEYRDRMALAIEELADKHLVAPPYGRSESFHLVVPYTDMLKIWDLANRLHNS